MGQWNKRRERKEYWMTASLKVSVGNLKGRMQLTGAAQSLYSVPIDYTPPHGEGKGFTSLELIRIPQS
jgi:hypothetical protein